MGLLQAAYRTYEGIEHLAGRPQEGMEPLCPMSHMIMNAQIEIAILDDGSFSGAKRVPKDENKTIIPVTEKSASRTGDNSCAHPLSDQLRYLAAYGGEKYEAYLENLRAWVQSEYTHPKAEAVLRYVESGTILRDLQTEGVIELSETGLPAAGKIEGSDYGKCLVRWRVLSAADGASSACWEDPGLFTSYIELNKQNLGEERALCMITGLSDVPTGSHPKGVVSASFGAKLISANDSSGFTYRGRFMEANQAGSVGYTASQKAHSALRWLTANHGTIIGGRTFLWWNPEGKKLPEFSVFGVNLRSEDDETAFTSYQEKLWKTIGSYKMELQPEDDAVVAALDAATTGRLSVTYYSEIKALDLIDRLEHWYKSCCWNTRYQDGWSPSLKSIVLYTWGTQRDTFIEVDDKLLREHVQRLLHCVIERRDVPTDLVRALFSRANQPLTYSGKNRENVLSTACAVVRKYRNDKGEVWNLALNEQEKNRSYLFGRLLAVAEKVERSTYGADENREPNAIRMQTMFSQRPMQTFRRLDTKLEPYYRRLSPGLRQYYRNLVQEIFAGIDQEDPELNKKLEDVYLLGYYHQRSALYPKKENAKEKTEVTGNEYAE